MTRTPFLATIAAAVLLAAVPPGANAQQPQQKPGPAAAPHPAAHAAPAPRPAPHPAPAPYIAAPRQAPHIAAPRMAPRHVAVPAQHSAPAIRNAVRQHTPPQIRHVERAHRNQPAITAHKTLPQIKTQPQIKQAQPVIKAQPQKQLTTLQQRRQDRLERRREARELRSLPPQQRATKREEFRHARELRLQQRQQTQAATQTNIKAQANKQQRQARHHDRNNRVTVDAARHGRFSAPFRNALLHSNDDRRAAWRAAHLAAHRAWHHGLRARFVAWYGPVFWPYAYSDIFDYAFWPYGYDDGYWAYAYDDFVDGLFWGQSGPPDEYVDAGPAPSSPAPRATYSAVQELCRQPGSGITAWPFSDIERKVGLNAEQRQLLNDMRDNASKAAAAFKQSCPAENDFALTPPGRLQAMAARLQATLDAVETVRPSLTKFYASLSDEQKERFNQLGPKRAAANAEAKAALPEDNKSCGEAKPGLTNLPIEKIEDVVKPSDAQEDQLNALDDATTKAVSILQAACPDETPITPPGRLEAMAKRLTAMIDAANTVKPALEDFYASLSNEQKARFNSIGRELAQTGG